MARETLTEAAMKANGFGIGLLATLARVGLAVATPGRGLSPLVAVQER
jgi:hypothetical protein